MFRSWHELFLCWVKNSVSAVDFRPSYNCSLLCTFDEKYRRRRDILFGFSYSLWQQSVTKITQYTRRLVRVRGGKFPNKNGKILHYIFYD